MTSNQIETLSLTSWPELGFVEGQRALERPRFNVMRILGLSAVCLFILGMILSSAHFWGLSQKPKTFEHAWFQLERPWRIAPLALLEKTRPRDFIWIDVIRSREQNLYAATSPLDLTKKNWSDQELQRLGFPPLKEALARVSERPLVLNLLSNVEGLDLQLSDLIGASGKDRILVQSEFDNLMRALKKLQPLWLYGSSQAERVRFRTFESLWILTATPFLGDVYVGPLKQMKVELLTENVAAEIKRRGQHLIVGPVKTKDEWDQALRLGADGVFIDHEDLLQ